jgi:hypothetical protein
MLLVIGVQLCRSTVKSRGTLHDILKQTGLTREDLAKLL